MLDEVERVNQKGGDGYGWFDKLRCLTAFLIQLDRLSKILLTIGVSGFARMLQFLGVENC
jgi:hypothetical protein